MEILNDFDTSIRRALDEIDPNFYKLPGLVICGTHKPHDTEMLIEKIREAREKKIPYLGLCFGHQLAAIEYARNVQGIKDATSEEFGKGTFVVKKMEQMKVGGYYDDEGSRWHNYEVVIDWEKPAWFITTQSHPEYESMKGKPHPLLKKFLKLCKQPKN